MQGRVFREGRYETRLRNEDLQGLNMQPAVRIVDDDELSRWCCLQLAKERGLLVQGQGRGRLQGTISLSGATKSITAGRIQRITASLSEAQSILDYSRIPPDNWKIH